MQQHSTEEKVTEKCLSAFKPRQSSVDLLTLFIRGEWTNNAVVPPNNYLGFFHSASEESAGVPWGCYTILQEVPKTPHCFPFGEG